MATPKSPIMRMPPQCRCGCVPNHPKFDTSWHDGFIKSMGEWGNVTFACKQVRVARAIAYEHKVAFPNFSQMWDDAKEEATDLLELEARKRALKSSDMLMMFMLNAERPDKFKRPSKIDHTVTARTDLTPQAEQQVSAKLQDFRQQMLEDMKRQQEHFRVIDVTPVPVDAARPAPIEDDEPLPWDEE